MAGFLQGFIEGWNSSYSGYYMRPRKLWMSRIFLVTLIVVFAVGILGGVELVFRLWPAWIVVFGLWCLGCAWAEHAETPKGHLPMADALRDDIEHP